VNMLPYFWRAGSGDGAEHVFKYSIYFDCVSQIWSCFLSGGKRLRFFQ